MFISNIHQAKTNLSNLIQQTLQGKEVVIAKAGQPVVRLIPFIVQKQPRVAGKLKGKIVIEKNFDEESPEIEKLFENTT